MNEKNTVSKDVFPIDSELEKKSIYEWAELAGIDFVNIDGFMNRDIATILGNDPIKNLPVTKYEFLQVKEKSKGYVYRENMDKHEKFLEDYYPMYTLAKKVVSFICDVDELAFEEYNKIEEENGRDYSIELYNNDKKNIKDEIDTIKRIHENMKNREDCYNYEKFEKILMDESNNLNEMLDKIEYPENLSKVYADEHVSQIASKIFDLLNETKEFKLEEQYASNIKPLYDIIKETEPERINEYLANLNEKDIDDTDLLSKEDQNILNLLDKKLKKLEYEDKELEGEEEMYKQKVGKDIDKEVGE